VQDYVSELITTIDAALPRLRALGEERSRARPAPGKWSPREIIGHLIDSAGNNHQRFVRAPAQDDLVFSGYDQDAWVSAQRYQDVPFADLLTLWHSYNRHIAHVMSAVPESVRLRPHQRHNLDRIGWQPVPADQPATLDYLMRDYVGHLRHHLRQILKDDDVRPA
jgi:hypothetical protein